jgi:hypothetical protein
MCVAMYMNARGVVHCVFLNEGEWRVALLSESVGMEECVLLSMFAAREGGRVSWVVRATRGKASRREWELAVHSALPASKRSSRGRGHACKQVELSSCWPHGMAVCMAALQPEGCGIDHHHAQCTTHRDPALLQQNKPRRHGCSDSGTLAFTQPLSLVLGCPHTCQTRPRCPLRAQQRHAAQQQM